MLHVWPDSFLTVSNHDSIFGIRSGFGVTPQVIDQKEKIQRKHRVAFKEAATVFRDPMSITFYDPDHSEEEDRFMTVGFSTMVDF